MNSLKDALSASDMLKEISPLCGYADGFYMCQCTECKRAFTGDKRAWHCLPCAVKGLRISAANAANVSDASAIKAVEATIAAIKSRPGMKGPFFTKD